MNTRIGLVEEWVNFERYFWSNCKPLLIGETITFHDAELGQLTGTILWVCAPGDVGGHEMPVRSIVEPSSGGFPECVYHSEVKYENAL